MRDVWRDASGDGKNTEGRLDGSGDVSEDVWGEEIHCPCIKEHFEVYKKLPKNWNSVKWSCNDKA